MGSRVSTYVILWVNLFTLLVSIGVLGYGTWLGARHSDDCNKFLSAPVLVIGASVFLISLIGFVGALKNVPILLWIYLILMFLLLAAIAAFTVFAFIITNNGAGHTVSGQRYKEYRLEDYSQWFQKQLNNTSNWKHLKSCLVKPDYCNKLIKEYKTLKQYKRAKLSPIEAGCCRPPSECGYPAKNASYYDLSFNPVSSNKDCKRYKNKRSVKCYNCNSCKAGVAQYLKREWKVAAIFNVIAFAVLVLLYCVGCYARRNASRSHNSKLPCHNQGGLG
ncbi:tetraspanin-10 isoform X2 [Cryptomeria japonica]|uniref:tetraspanin-10 isoform X2 n=1 Tax=Cryptomeria japonica TaxID=3369 RepID=UPI0027DA056F|nr:tetraspanin-10 isoform X2 [Cryptomeria japonica]